MQYLILLRTIVVQSIVVKLELTRLPSCDTAAITLTSVLATTTPPSLRAVTRHNANRRSTSVVMAAEIFDAQVYMMYYSCTEYLVLQLVVCINQPKIRDTYILHCGADRIQGTWCITAFQQKSKDLGYETCEGLCMIHVHVV